MRGGGGASDAHLARAGGSASVSCVPHWLILAASCLQGEGNVGGVPAAYVAQIEQGLGEMLRRLERKVDAVASLLDQVREGRGA